MKKVEFCYLTRNCLVQHYMGMKISAPFNIKPYVIIREREQNSLFLANNEQFLVQDACLV